MNELKRSFKDLEAYLTEIDMLDLEELAELIAEAEEFEELTEAE